MKFCIFGLDLSQQIKSDLTRMANSYDAQFSIYSTLDQLAARIESIHQPVVIVLNINENQNAKYLFTTQLRNRPNTYFLYTSSNFNLDDRVRWLSFGANGYLQKPYRAEELLILSSSLATPKTKFTLSDSNFNIDLEFNVVHYKHKQIYLSPIPFKVLTYLVHYSGQIVTRQELVECLFNQNNDINERKIDTYIKIIRRAINKDVIQTIRGQGYLYQETNIKKKVQS